MGDVADMMLDGTLCECCGCYMGDAPGVTQLCEGCIQDLKRAAVVVTVKKVKKFSRPVSAQTKKGSHEQ